MLCFAIDQQLLETKENILKVRCIMCNSTGISKMVPVEDSSAETDSAVVHSEAQVSARTVKGF